MFNKKYNFKAAGLLEIKKDLLRMLYWVSDVEPNDINLTEEENRVRKATLRYELKNLILHLDILSSPGLDKNDKKIPPFLRALEIEINRFQDIFKDLKEGDIDDANFKSWFEFRSALDLVKQ